MHSSTLQTVAVPFLLLLGGGAWFGAFFLSRLDPIANASLLVAWGLGFGVVLAVGFGGVVWRVWPSSERVLRVSVGVLSVVFALGLGQVIAFGINRLTPKRAPFAQRVVVAGMSRSAQSEGDVHHVHLKSWFSSDLVTIQTDPSAYQSVSIGAPVVVTSQTGLLGGVWLHGWETFEGVDMTIQDVWTKAPL